jgi:hypothetical protein
VNLARHFEKHHKELFKQMKKSNIENKFLPQEDQDFSYKDITEEERLEVLRSLPQTSLPVAIKEETHAESSAESATFEAK